MAILGLLIPMLLSSLPLLLIVIGQWKTNKKAGRPGWHTIIPLLCQYTRANIGGNMKNFWGLLICCSASALCGIFGVILENAVSETMVLICGLTSLPFVIMAIVFAIKLENSVSRAFGKNGGFTAGLILLPFVFNPILGFGKAEYEGEVPEVKQKTSKAPKEPKAKKESKVRKEKPIKGKKSPVIHSEPEEEVEPPRPEFQPQYDTGEEESPVAPRMTMDQMMLQSLKSKKAPPPSPSEEPKPAPVENKKSEAPSNRFSIPVEYVPETPKVEVPKADYLIPAFARPDYHPTPPTTPETPAPPTPIITPVSAPVYEQTPVPQYEQAPYQVQHEEPNYQETAAQESIDPFKFFGIPDTIPVSQYQKTPLQIEPEGVKDSVETTPVIQQPAPMKQEPQYVPQSPVIEPVYTATATPQYEELTPTPVAAPVVEQTFTLPVQPESEISQPMFGPIEPVVLATPVNKETVDIPGFTTNPTPQPTKTPWAQPVTEQDASAPMPHKSEEPPTATVPVQTEEPSVMAPPVVEPSAPISPKAPIRFVDPKPTEEKKSVADDDEELPPPPVVSLPPKKNFFHRKSTAIDRFHNEDGGLK